MCPHNETVNTKNETKYCWCQLLFTDRWLQCKPKHTTPTFTHLMLFNSKILLTTINKLKAHIFIWAYSSYCLSMICTAHNYHLTSWLTDLNRIYNSAKIHINVCAALCKEVCYRWPQVVEPCSEEPTCSPPKSQQHVVQPVASNKLIWRSDLRNQSD